MLNADISRLNTLWVARIKRTKAWITKITKNNTQTSMMRFTWNTVIKHMCCQLSWQQHHSLPVLGLLLFLAKVSSPTRQVLVTSRDKTPDMNAYKTVSTHSIFCILCSPYFRISQQPKTTRIYRAVHQMQPIIMIIIIIITICNNYCMQQCAIIWKSFCKRVTSEGKC